MLVEDLEPVRAFYLERLGYPATFDMPNYLQVRFGQEASAPELCFMISGDGPEFASKEIYDGRGILVSVPVQDPDAHAAALGRFDSLSAERQAVALASIDPGPSETTERLRPPWGQNEADAGESDECRPQP